MGSERQTLEGPDPRRARLSKGQTLDVALTLPWGQARDRGVAGALCAGASRAMAWPWLSAPVPLASGCCGRYRQTATTAVANRPSRAPGR
jgi:hypothetical protein